MNIEDLVRATQARQADRAVPVERIRSALPARVARAHRQRRLGVLGAVVAAGAVAAAVTVPALVVRHNGSTVAGPPGVTAARSGAPATGPSGASAEPATPQLRDARLGYRPTWVPAGYEEYIRSADIGDPADVLGPTVMRVWKKRVGAGDPWGGAELALYVRTGVTGAATAMDSSGEKVDIGGHRGYYGTGGPGDHKSSVNWSLDAHTLLMVTAQHLDISRADLLRLARSVKPDPGTVTAPVRLKWLPPGWVSTDFLVSGASAATWRGEVIAGRAAPEPTTSAGRKAEKDPGTSAVGTVSVVVGTTTDAPGGGKTLTVGGHPARHPLRTDLAGQSLIYLVVDLGHGRLMTLMGEGGGITLDDLTTIAARTEIAPTDLKWLGH